MREIPQIRFTEFYLLYKNDEGEYAVLNDVRMADIRLASLVYLECLRYHVLRAYFTFASNQAVSITLFLLGQAQIIMYFGR